MADLRAIPGGKAGGSTAATVGHTGVTHDASLLRDLYERYAPSVHSRCRYLLRDDEGARDATQEVFARALRALPEFRAAASPLTWVLRIATYYCLNLRRAERVATRERLRQLASPAAEELGSGLSDKRELVRALLSSAPSDTQEIAILYYVDELTQQEIGDAVGLSLPTVRKRLRQFLAAARSALAEALPHLSLPEGDDL
jgi:RNA polymerase sigma factor (sigma-70 family)